MVRHPSEIVEFSAEKSPASFGTGKIGLEKSVPKSVLSSQMWWPLQKNWKSLQESKRAWKDTGRPWLFWALPSVALQLRVGHGLLVPSLLRESVLRGGSDILYHFCLEGVGALRFQNWKQPKQLTKKKCLALLRPWWGQDIARYLLSGPKGAISPPHNLTCTHMPVQYVTGT